MTDRPTEQSFCHLPIQVYKGNGDYMFSTGYGREFQQDVGDTYDFTMGAFLLLPPHTRACTNALWSLARSLARLLAGL